MISWTFTNNFIHLDLGPCSRLDLFLPTVNNQIDESFGQPLKWLFKLCLWAHANLLKRLAPKSREWIPRLLKDTNMHNVYIVSSYRKNRGVLPPSPHPSPPPHIPPPPPHPILAVGNCAHHHLKGHEYYSTFCSWKLYSTLCLSCLKRGFR